MLPWRYVAPALLPLVLLSACAPQLPPALHSAVAFAAPAPAHAPLVDAIVRQTNRERGVRGLSPLSISRKLSHAAGLHARQMAESGRLAHELPGTTFPTLGSRAEAVGYRYEWFAENIAGGSADVARIMAGWMASAGHRGSILHPGAEEIGVAVFPGKDGRYYYVSVFGRARS